MSELVFRHFQKSETEKRRLHFLKYSILIGREKTAQGNLTQAGQGNIEPDQLIFPPISTLISGFSKI